MMEKLRSAIGFLVISIILFQALLIPVYASNSTINLKPNLSTSTNSTTQQNSTEALEASKKDKRQAQRGYTDIPLDEGPFDDITNSSPPPIPAFESDLPPLAEKLNDFGSNYLPENLNNKIDRNPENSFFASRLGFPAALPRLDDVPAAAATIQERRDDFFDDSGDAKPIPGEAGRDYPTFAKVPRTGFSCKDQQWPGYYADTEARCQVFWICQKHRMDAFLCPNGTLFNQQVFVCDWWFNVDCNGSPEFYSRNQFLYQGPGIGIDGKPTRFAGAPGSSGAANAFVNSVLPRPIGVNSNPLANQVQSSNQISRLATASQPSPPLKVQSQTSFYDGGSSNNKPQQKYVPSQFETQQTYVSSQSQQSQQKYSSSQSQNQQSSTFPSSQSMLANRMQKNGRPNNGYSGGGYQSNQLSFNSQSESDRRAFSGTSPSQSSKSYEGGRSNSFQDYSNTQISSTQRPASLPTSLRPPPSSTPRINVNIDSKSSKQSIGSISGTVGSTSRPAIRVNTDIPLFGPGSSTLRTPKEIVNQFTQSSATLIGSSQNVYNISVTSRPATTRAPTTFRSTTAQYSPPASTQQPPNSFNTKQFGAIKSEYGTPSTPRPSPAPTNNFFTTNTKYGPPGYAPPETLTPLNTGYGVPGQVQGIPLGLDRGGFGKESRQEHAYISSTPQPFGYNSLERRGFLGQRSNQFSNINGQREIMYSPSQNTYVEFPYSPSQQKNKQRLLELQASHKGITSTKDIFAYPHFHGQRSNAFSDGDSVSYINTNNKQVNINHETHSQRKTPFVDHTVNPNVHLSTLAPHHHGVPQEQQFLNQPPVHPPQNHHNQQQNYNPQIQHPPQNHHQGHNQHHHNIPPPNNQIGHNQNVPQNIQQSSQNVPQIHNQHQQHHQNQLHQQYHQQIQPQPNQQPNNQFKNRPQTFSSPSSTPAVPFHQRIVQVPSQNLELPVSNPQSAPATLAGPRNGYTSLQSGSFISVATTASPFSQQILSHSALQGGGKQGKHKHNKNQVFGTTEAPFAYSSSPNNFGNFLSSPAPSHDPNQFVSLSTTLKPPLPHSTPAPFTNDAHAFSKKAAIASHSQPTPYTNQNSFIASPTQTPITSTSPGHRQNPFVPHNHGKRSKGQKQQQNHGIQFPNSVISTTIKYPEGTGSLRIAIPNSGSGKRNLVDFSYSAYPKSSTVSPKSPSSTTTPYPSISERFNNIVSSTTLRPLNPSSPQPQYKESLRIGSGARLAGAVINKSTSSSNAIYVDTSATAETAESVSTPVSVFPSASPPPPVATSNFGLRISSTAKKRMAGAWQNYFNGNEKENAN